MSDYERSTSQVYKSKLSFTPRFMIKAWKVPIEHSGETLKKANDPHVTQRRQSLWWCWWVANIILTTLNVRINIFLMISFLVKFVSYSPWIILLSSLDSLDYAVNPIYTTPWGSGSWKTLSEKVRSSSVLLIFPKQCIHQVNFHVH